MIVVVGAGLTGLSLGWELSRRGAPHLVLEASARPGGVIRSGRVDEHLLEWGPQRARMTRSLAEQVAALGIGEEVITAPRGLPLFVYRGGRLRRVPFDPRGFLRSDLLSWRGKLRLLLEPLTAAPRDDERVAHLLTRKMGREAYESLLGPLYGGLYASDPANMVVGLSLAHVLREFGIGRSLLLKLLASGGAVVPPPAVSFRDGLETLPRALYRANQENVRLSTPVERVVRDGSGFRVEAGGEGIEARAVVVTAPAAASAAVLADLAPEAARAIGSLRYNPLAVVHLHARTDLRGLGYQVSFAEPLATRGVTFNDSLFGREGVYTAYLGGAKRPEVVALPDADVAELAVREFRLATGHDAAVLSVAREAMPAWDASWAALPGLDLPAGVYLAANWESRPGMPGRLAQAARLAARLAGE